MQCKRSPHGFTALEVLLAIVIVGLVAGLGAPILQSVFLRNQLDVAVNEYVQTLRKARTYSLGVRDDSSWGVYATSGSVILFKGATYASRDTTADEIGEMSTNITVSGTNEFVFSKMSGNPTASSSSILTLPSGATRTIGVNSKGKIEY